MPRHSQWPESAKIAPVLESYEAEWYDDEQDCLLVYVPAEEK